MRTVTLSPQNSMILVEDSIPGDVPTEDRPDPIMRNARCVSVGTLMQYDGETAISLGRLSEISRDEPPAFDGIIETPSGSVVVSVLPDVVILQEESGSPKTRLVIWTNDPREPDEIVIGVERAAD